jgi:MazG family protein
MEELCKEFIEFINILQRVRRECPWDKKQTPYSLLTYFLEECYELVESIQSNAKDNIKEELGDVFIHIVMQSLMAEERGDFTLTDVLKNVNNKLITRHPHVFGEKETESVKEILYNWENIKQEENNKGILDGIPKILPSLIASFRIQEKASHVGFDWKNAKEIFYKLKEEISELEKAIEENNKENIEGEIGDLLFTIVNISRHLGIDPELALRKTNLKFVNRFKFLERKIKEEGKKWEDVTIEEMDKWWEISKNSF